MSILQLRSHIPIGGPARREPADGTESPMRVSLGFEPAWYYRRCGVDFSEHWHSDPIYRHDMVVRMKAELCRSFPTVGYWRLDEPDDTWTLSGAYGAFVIPQVFGCTLQYAPERWPVVVSKSTLSLEELANLERDDLLSGAFVEELFAQMDVIEHEGGKIHGYLNWQGVLNNAFNIYGQAIFVDMADKPGVAHEFLALICDVMIALMQKVQERQRRSGFYINQGDLSNCVMNLISPRAYKQFVFPYDKKIAENFERFGVHTCNWNATPYLQVLSELPQVGYLDMGIMSDLCKAREMFPNTRRAVMYSPVVLQDASIEEIHADMLKIRNELSPCDVVMADIQATTPNARVNELLDICRSLEHSQ